MKKVGMVLEGGSMRGMYSAGVMDVMMENNIEIDGIVGTSAGGLFGPNYFSKQKGRVIRYNKKYCNDKRYISKRSLILTGNLVNKKFAFYKVTKELDPFDNETYIKSNKDMYVIATNVESGLPEYFKITDVYNQLEYLRATSALPIVSKMVKLEGKKYLDGGISDSIPIRKCETLGYDKIIVILTQPLDYRKKPLSSKKEKLVNKKFKKFPKLIEAMLNRYNVYNETIEYIIDKEKKKEIFVVRPSKTIDININEQNPEKYQEVYDLGVEDGKNIIEKLKKYLKK